MQVAAAETALTTVARAVASTWMVHCTAGVAMVVVAAVEEVAEGAAVAMKEGAALVVTIKEAAMAAEEAAVVLEVTETAAVDAVGWLGEVAAPEDAVPSRGLPRRLTREMTWRAQSTAQSR